MDVATGRTSGTRELAVAAPVLICEQLSPTIVDPWLAMQSVFTEALYGETSWTQGQQRRSREALHRLLDVIRRVAVTAVSTLVERVDRHDDSRPGWAALAAEPPAGSWAGILERAAARQPRWQRRAACAGLDPDLFFPLRGESAAEATGDR